MANLVQKVDSSSMREDIQSNLIRLGPKFWEYMESLPPKAFLEVYLKMMPFGFAKVPDERPLDDDTRRRMILEETNRKMTIIGGGLPQVEDAEE